MKLTFALSRCRRILAALLCLCLLCAVGCQRSNLPRTPKDAVIRDPIRTEPADVDTFPSPNDYYFEGDYLPNKAAVINELLADSGDNAEAFVFVTDPHTEENNNAGQTPALVHYLCTQTNLSRAIVCGDVHTGIATDYVSTMEKAFSDGTVHYVMGNLEYSNATIDADLFNVYNQGKTEQIGNTDRHYYYVDSPDNKLRYIVLNAWSEGNVTAEDLDIQNQWLKDDALQVEDGWGILIFIHSFVVREWNRSTDLRYFLPAMKPIAKTLLEYDGNGEIVGVFHGFRHQDMMSRMRLNADGNPVLDDGCGGIPLIQTACDKYVTNKDAVPYEMLIDREVGTVTEQAFDVVVVDRENGKLHCVRIGAPARDKSGWLNQEQVEIRTINIRE